MMTLIIFGAVVAENRMSLAAATGGWKSAYRLMLSTTMRKSVTN